MNRLLLIFYVVLSLVFSSCSNSNVNDDFLNKYAKYDFSQYEGYEVFIRGGDLVNKGNSIVFITSSTDSKRGIYILSINRKNHTIAYSKWNSEKDPCDFDIEELKELAAHFLDFGIARLTVDTNGCVFVYKRTIENLDYVRLPEESIKSFLGRPAYGWYKPYDFSLSQN